MRRIIDNDYLTLLARVAIGGMYLFASYDKIIHPALFAKSIWQYHLVPGSLINLIALGLPWLELVIGVALIVGISYRGAVHWANLLLVMFMIALASTIFRGIDIACGCFKAGQTATGPAWNALWFDVGVMVLAVQLCLSKSKRWMFQSS